ncbi:MAG: CPBP family intramembrane metalloprotease, partial [Desulfobacterales bacterium]|nr:CPBP family intramembrane metalloprotease [Desulfobacterales bacterium]
TVIISILVIAAIEIIVRLVINQNLVAPLIGLGLARLSEIIFLLTLIKISEKGFSVIGLTSANVYKGFKKGFVWAVIFGVAAGVVLFIIYLLGINVPALFQMQLPAKNRNIFAFFLIGAFFGPLAEEIFFRGILYGFFRRWGIPAAVILSTLLFVLSHTSGPAIPVTQLIGGILFAVAYEIEKNLLVPIIIHVLGNLAIFTIALIL